jgi:hypothetical protein
MPYFSYITMLHLYESLGWWRAGEQRMRLQYSGARWVLTLTSIRKLVLLYDRVVELVSSDRLPSFGVSCAVS